MKLPWTKKKKKVDIGQLRRDVDALQGALEHEIRPALANARRHIIDGK